MDEEVLNLVAPGKMTKQPKHYFPDIRGNRKKLIRTQIKSYPWITEGKKRKREKKSLLDPSAINAAMLDAARWIFGPAGGLEDIEAPCHPCRCALATFLLTANQRLPVVIRDLSAQITHGDPTPGLRFSPICRPSLVIGKRERREPRRGRSRLVAGRSRSVGCPVCSRDFLPPPHALPAPRFLLVPHIIAALRKYWHTSPTSGLDYTHTRPTPAPVQDQHRFTTLPVWLPPFQNSGLLLDIKQPPTPLSHITVPPKSPPNTCRYLFHRPVNPLEELAALPVDEGLLHVCQHQQRRLFSPQHALEITIITLLGSRALSLTSSATFSHPPLFLVEQKKPNPGL